MGKKVLIVIGIIVLAIVAALVSAIIWYNSSIKPINSGNPQDIKVDIKGSAKTVAQTLEENGVIKSALAMRIYMKKNNTDKLVAGKYLFSTSDDVKTILDKICNGEIAEDEVKITFIEGKNMRYIAKKIAENTNNSENDVFSLIEDEEYIDALISRYWFLTEEIKNPDIYYPLEGYLFPDTYTYETKDVKVATIIEQMLDNMEKTLEKFKEEIQKSDLNIHQILTLASMAELEGGNQKDEDGISDRAKIVGVFVNRINKKMKLGSDVTAYYAFKVDMSERDLTTKELNTQNPYNTRGPEMEGKLPVGPICNPSVEAIDAAVNPNYTDYLYFVSDKNQKCYFTKTYNEHQNMIKELKNKKLWYTYE